jgi:hypothetical protein
MCQFIPEYPEDGDSNFLRDDELRLFSVGSHEDMFKVAAGVDIELQ